MVLLGKNPKRAKDNFNNIKWVKIIMEKMQKGEIEKFLSNKDLTIIVDQNTLSKIIGDLNIDVKDELLIDRETGEVINSNDNSELSLPEFGA